MTKTIDNTRKKYKFLTLNINSVNARLDFLKTCITKHNPDVVMLQETKCEEYKFPALELKEMGYNYIVVHGQKSYNGVAIMSKFKLGEPIFSFKENNFLDDARYIETTVELPEIGEVKIICIYCPNGYAVKSEKYNQKLIFFNNLKNHLENLLSTNQKILISGDINIAPYDIDVYSAPELQNCLAFTIKERCALREIMNMGFVDCYRALNNNTQEFSWFDYRNQGLERRTGFRIDLFLVDAYLADYLVGGDIDVDSRKCLFDFIDFAKFNQKPSDHCPIIADFHGLA